MKKEFNPVIFTKQPNTIFQYFISSHLISSSASVMTMMALRHHPSSIVETAVMAEQTEREKQSDWGPSLSSNDISPFKPAYFLLLLFFKVRILPNEPAVVFSFLIGQACSFRVLFVFFDVLSHWVTKKKEFLLWDLFKTGKHPERNSFSLLSSNKRPFQVSPLYSNLPRYTYMYLAHFYDNKKLTSTKLRIHWYFFSLAFYVSEKKSSLVSSNNA